MRKDATVLGKDLAFDEAQQGILSVIAFDDAEYKLFAEPSAHIDNEYSRAGIYDPKIVITTSRDPSSKLLQFAKVFVDSLLATRFQ